MTRTQHMCVCVSSMDKEEVMTRIYVGLQGVEGEVAHSPLTLSIEQNFFSTKSTAQ